jgi:hypothetical protein
MNLFFVINIEFVPYMYRDDIFRPQHAVFVKSPAAGRLQMGVDCE